MGPRLTDVASPTSYDITFDARETDAALSGAETIGIQLRRSDNKITMNDDGVAVTDATIDGENATVAIDAKPQQITFTAAHGLAPGAHVLSLHFQSNTQHEQYGMLAAPKQMMSFFESAYARTIFPCFDEPQFRARFTVHALASTNASVISNMPVTRREPSGSGATLWSFEPTPPMPVYLLTLDVGDFEPVRGTSDGVPIAVWTDAAHLDAAKTVLTDAERFLPFYHRFFGIAYPLPKLDIVVGTNMMESALEGWGAINISSAAGAFGQQMGGGDAGRRYAAEVVAHEMAHQWVGDLVTMRWWRDTFVAEGLAEFSQREAMQQVYPAMNAWRDDDYDLAVLMNTAVGPQMVAALLDVKSDLASDAEAIFAQATYDKGASIVDGWLQFVGERTFHERLTAYLRRYAYGNARYEDFWREMGGNAGTRYGLRWLGQKGFPVVSVSWKCTDQKTVLHLSQTPFAADPTVQRSYHLSRWPIPLTVEQGSHTSRIMFAGDSATVVLAGCQLPRFDSWGTQYYRLQYPADQYGKVARSLMTASQRMRERFYTDTAALTAIERIPASAFSAAFDVRPQIETSIYAVPGASGLSISDEFQKIEQGLRGSPKHAAFVHLEESVLEPISKELFSGQQTGARSRGSATRVLLTLDAAGDRHFAAQARAKLDDPATNFSEKWALAQSAGATIRRADIEQLLPIAKRERNTESWTPELVFLLHAGNPQLARTIFRSLIDDRAPCASCLEIAGQMAPAHPGMVLNEVRTDPHSIVRSVPPSFQAWALASLIADDLWYAAPAEQLDALLRREVRPLSKLTYDQAVNHIREHLRTRNQLEKSLTPSP